MFKKLSLRVKILMMVLPLAVGFIFSSLNVIKQYYEHGRQLEGINVVADNLGDVGNLIHNLQIERGKTGLFLSGKLAAEDLKKQRDVVDPFWKEAKRMISLLPYSAEDAKTLENVYDMLPKIREKADAKAPAAEVAAMYSKMIQECIVGEGVASALYAGEGLEKRLVNLTIVETIKESMGKTRAAYSAVFAADAPITTDDVGRLESIRAGIMAGANSPALELAPLLNDKVHKVIESDKWKSVNQDLAKLLPNVTTGHYGVDGKKFFLEISEVIETVNSLLGEERSDIMKVAQAESKKAYYLLWSVVLGVLIFTVGIGIFTWLTIRSLVNSLEGMVTELTSGGDSVANASLEISEASTELSSSATEQAAALQETVASIDEVGAMIAKSSDNAKLSQEVAVASNEGAQKGRQAVNDMVNAIEEISKSNNEIANQIEQSNQQLTDIVKVISEIGTKTKVINDIVFQTKLLSFNASVEAARAGEHGKGFAVVAEEVGNLAQMSGNAAKEISQMLDASIQRVERIVNETKTKVEGLVSEGKDKVETGTVVAKRCGEALEGIVTNVGEMNRMVAEIATATNEQSQGMAEISKAMSQLDQVTQQNTMAAQNSASATEKLNEQAEGVRRIVGDLRGVIRGEGEHKEHTKPKNHEVKKTAKKSAKVLEFNSAAKPESKEHESPSSLKKAANGEAVPSSEDPRFEDV